MASIKGLRPFDPKGAKPPLTPRGKPPLTPTEGTNGIQWNLMESNGIQWNPMGTLTFLHYICTIPVQV